ncbi:dTDP-4-dehydrorhamnose 3,5-epimerase [Luteimonas yindakuii]|uniref:dTDP-4-dehydrorhamnose 3,5-epimerase n=1 Tax=Luteimonas yindakuii TaxID=2565782 RepID=A0A4Z1R835_9GAMM|nr:dTDP-4-dehydrorhamnose 3,5-epimerase [Luteimonas yindakuii]QCO67093.1 dTDP-4-dehydrorhamnose 3,5-epimerase [Luteimonas yindakuii]TKS52788.1 dTDP-4-dehydrorhamnose 3,5-epimerase [Luteimonas yindakuii]
MKIIETPLPGCLIIEPAVFGDERGCFYETWNAERYRQHGLPSSFVQSNASSSVRGVLRGLHYQWPHPQGKLVSVMSGEVFDVAVDIRKGSPTFGQWTSVLLSAENKRQFWIPEGFAHGFMATSEHAVFTYLCTDLYNSATDSNIAWDDPEIGIEWPDIAPSLSAKDARAPRLRDVSDTQLPVFSA